MFVQTHQSTVKVRQTVCLFICLITSGQINRRYRSGTSLNATSDGLSEEYEVWSGTVVTEKSQVQVLNLPACRWASKMNLPANVLKAAQENTCFDSVYGGQNPTHSE